MSLPVDTTILCKFFFQHWIGGGGGRGEVITEIERNIKSLIIFARDFNPVQKLLRQLSHFPPPQQAMLDKQYKGILSVKSFFQHLIGGWEGGGVIRETQRNIKSLITFARDFNPVQKLLRQLSHCPLPPTSNVGQYTIFLVKFFFNIEYGGEGGGEAITEIERNIKSLIIFARDCSLWHCRTTMV